MNNGVKCIKGRIIEIALYFLLIVPHLLCLFFSVPASDDFCFGIQAFSKNPVSEACQYSWYNWLQHSGRWLTFIFQKMICPLNSHKHLGHVYGIYMMCVFIVVLVIFVYSLKKIFSYILNTQSKRIVSVVTYITIMILLSTFYYVEAYNWYIGATAYAVPLALEFLAFSFILNYAHFVRKMDYVLMIVIGLIPTSNEFLCVPLGIWYVYFIFIKPMLASRNSPKNDVNKFEKLSSVSIVKKIIPLFCYVVMGLSVVAAPGNFIRQSTYNVESSLLRSVIQTVIDVLVRLKAIIVDHPFIVLLLIVLLLIGMFFNSNKCKPTSILLVLFLEGMTCVGAVFPYIYGRGLTSTYLDNRMQYVLDYFLEISLATLMLLLGQYLAYKFDITITKLGVLKLAAILGLFAYGTLISNYAFLEIVQVDILKNYSLIKQSYNLWNGILLEIEQSDSQNVVVNRKSDVIWLPYFLYSGMVSGEKYDVKPGIIYSTETIMPNLYYGKESIIVEFENTDN